MGDKELEHKIFRMFCAVFGEDDEDHQESERSELATSELMNLIKAHSLQARIDELEASIEAQWKKGLSSKDWKQYHLDRIAQLQEERGKL